MSSDTIIPRKVKALIIDDSKVMRELLSAILADDPTIEVVGAAEDPIMARSIIKSLAPDVLTLDIDMPKMNGLEFLRRLMKLNPLPTVVISSHVQPGGAMTIKALEMGAVDCVGKPGGSDTHSLLSLADDITLKVKEAANADMQAARARAARWRARFDRADGASASAEAVIAIGASMGGVQALCKILPAFAADTPPLLIAQHMPGGFTRSFAERLDGLTRLSVREATDGAELRRGEALLAPGGYHLTVFRKAGRRYCRISERVDHEMHAPCIDRLFTSLADCAGTAGVGILLTGMGKDGAEGLLRMRLAGATTICQDKATSLVYGMPAAAAAIGAALYHLPLARIPGFVSDLGRGTPARAPHSGLTETVGR